MSSNSETVPDTIEATVVLPAHLHARPAGKLARTAAQFSSTLEIEHNGTKVDPRGVLAVMGLGATAGTHVTIRAQGQDAHQALADLTAVLAAAE
jgi:phosphotransferase system HPr (HPr) family protein